jgi:hypothetical protein
MARISRKRWIGLVLALPLLAMSNAAGADEYDPQRSGHPVRIVAYAVHPVGVLIDRLILRPAHWVVSREPWKTIFGHTD